LLAVRQAAKLLPESASLKAALSALSPDYLTAVSSPGVLGAAILAVSDVLSCSHIQGFPIGIVDYSIHTIFHRMVAKIIQFLRHSAH
jgi:hypothetical protein